MSVNSKISVLAFVALLAACKKDETTNNNNNNNNTPPPKKTELLPDSKWMKTVYKRTTFFSGNSSTQDMWSTEQDCVKDDLLILKKDFSVYEDAGAVKCHDQEPQQDSAGTWALTANNTKYVFNSIHSYSDTLDIVEVSDTAFKLEHRFSKNGYDYLETTSYKKMK